MCIVCEVRRISKPNFKVLFGRGRGSIEDGAMAGSPLLDEPQFTSSPSLINTMTDNANIDGILGETRFRDLNLTFAFPQTTADYESNYAEFDKGILTFVPITESMKAANRFAFQTAASFSGLTFTEVSTPLTATLRVGLFTPSPRSHRD